MSVPGWLPKAARVVFALAGVAFLAVTFAATWDRSEGLPLASWPRLLLAVGVTVVALGLALRAWALLLGVPPSRQLAWGFFLSQLGKYVPGGVWQAVGQVGYARALVTTSRATVAFGLFALTQTVAGGLVGAFVAIAPGERPTWLRWAALAAPLLVALLHRRWMVRLIRLYVERRSESGIDPEAVIPPQRVIARSTAWSVLVHALMGVAFGLALPGALTGAHLAAAIPSFALAWTVGFLALPVPAGVGVREAVLLAAVSGPPAAGVVAASVAYRLAMMVAEVTNIGLARLVWPRHRER